MSPTGYCFSSGLCFPEMLPPGYFSSLLEIFAILLEDQIVFCALFWEAPQSRLQTLSPEMFPTGYCFSSGLCFQRCFQLVIASLLEIFVILLEDQIDFCALFGKHHSLACRPCLQRCFQLAIASLLDSVFQRCYQLVIASLLEIFAILLEDQIDFCALLGGTTVSLIHPVS